MLKYMGGGNHEYAMINNFTAMEKTNKKPNSISRHYNLKNLISDISYDIN